MNATAIDLIKGRTFDSFMREIDQELIEQCSLESSSLPDYRFYDSWLAGLTPKVTAKLTIKNAESYGW